jgi:cyclase
MTSRREFLHTSAAAALLAALGRPSALSAALGRPSTLGAVLRAQQATFTPIRRNVGCFTMRGGTIGYLVNAGGVAVVDSQYPAEAAAFLEGLAPQSGGRPVDALINTHHHGDHTAGNVVFRGLARRVVAHVNADEHMRRPPAAPATINPSQVSMTPPGGQLPADALFPDTTFTDTWSADVGDERIVARYHGRAHTSGDAVITFERANVVHMGDLMFNQRHPVVDGPAGATIRGWITVLERVAGDHASDTVYIFGHAGSGQPVTGDRTSLTGFRDYFTALLAFVEAQVRAGHSHDEVLAMREPLAGFESYGRFGQPGPRDALTVAYDEVTAA